MEMIHIKIPTFLIGNNLLIFGQLYDLKTVNLFDSGKFTVTDCFTSHLFSVLINHISLMFSKDYKFTYLYH